MKTTTKSIKSLYPATRVTKSTAKKLWVAFPEGNPEKGLVYSSKLSRDTVRNAASKVFGVAMSEVRSRRVENLRARKIRNAR